MSDPAALVLSIQPKYVEYIRRGIKTYELRRVAPNVVRGDHVLVYASSPIKAFVGMFRVESVSTMPPSDLWRLIEESACVSKQEYDDYFRGASRATGIAIGSHHWFKRPMTLRDIRVQLPSFQPPQSYRYVENTSGQLRRLLTQVARKKCA